MRKTLVLSKVGGFILVAIILLITLSALLAIRFLFGGSQTGTALLSKLTPMANFQLLAPRENNGKILTKYACDGENINPPLTIQGAPEGAKSLVMLMDDPDIPQFVKDRNKIQVWDHWVIFNMPPTITQIKENTMPPGIQGRNTSGKNAYGGPCPPDGEHRYFFKLYALDSMLDLKAGATKAEVESAMQGHIIASFQLIGRYTQLAK